jgi:hypothetical protein
MGRFDMRVIDREASKAEGRKEKIPSSQQLVWRAEWDEVCRKKREKM